MLAMLCFAGMDAISKWLVADYAISQMMWIRYGVFCLFAWLVVRRQRPARRRSARGGPGCRSARSLLAVIESAIFVLAFRYLPLADAHAIAATSPLIVIALGVLFLGERAGLARWLAVAAGFAGVLLIVQPGFRTFDWPLLLPLVGAVLWAGYQILTRLCSRARFARHDADLVGVRRLRRHHAGRADRAGNGRTPSAWTLMVAIVAAGRAGALCADQGARLCRGERRAALQLHPAGLGRRSWALVVFGDIPDHWTIAGRGHHRGQRPLHLAPRPADEPRTRLWLTRPLPERHQAAVDRQHACRSPSAIRRRRDRPRHGRCPRPCPRSASAPCSCAARAPRRPCAPPSAYAPSRRRCSWRGCSASRSRPPPTW